MLNNKLSFLLLIIVAFLIVIAPVQAQGTDVVSLVTGTASTAGFLLLLPLGLILFLCSTLPRAEPEAPQAATSALVVWGVASLAYFAAGFAFQFGGLAVSNAHPDFAELYWNWSPLGESFGIGWGVIGLRGWALLGPAATPGVYDLFLRHLAMLGVVVVIPTFALYQRAKAWMLPVFGLLAGTLIYPLAGNWVWSAGWLANLGLNQGLGHGFVDAGLGTPFLLAGVITLIALIAFRRADESAPIAPADEFTEVPMPSAYLPLLGFLGLGLVMWSWAFVANAQHIPTAADISVSMPRAALNGVLALLAGSVAAAFYSRFTTAEYNPAMTARGGLAGLVIVSAVSPFIPPWIAVASGLLAGLLTPLLIYLVDHKLKLDDHTAGVAIFGLPAFLALLLPGLLADGSGGAGWNGIEGGVAGVLVAPGFAVNWPGQINAQLLGAVALVVWTALIAAGLFKLQPWLAARRSARAEKTRSAETLDPAVTAEQPIEAADEADESASENT